MSMSSAKIKLKKAAKAGVITASGIERKLEEEWRRRSVKAKGGGKKRQISGVAWRKPPARKKTEMAASERRQWRRNEIGASAVSGMQLAEGVAALWHQWRNVAYVRNENGANGDQLASSMASNEKINGISVMA